MDYNIMPIFIKDYLRKYDITFDNTTRKIIGIKDRNSGLQIYNSIQEFISRASKVSHHLSIRQNVQVGNCEDLTDLLRNL